ncbi:MAG: hypothetical protein ABSH32_15150 [Bryobacteraceae bacterium]|jgi:hypothetical protein
MRSDEEDLFARRGPHTTNGHACVVIDFLQIYAGEAREYLQGRTFALSEMEVRRFPRVQRVQERCLGQAALGQYQDIHRVLVD